LTHWDFICHEPEPIQIFEDGCFEVRLAALPIVILDP